MSLLTLILWSLFPTKGITLTCFQCSHGHSETCVDNELECPDGKQLCGVTRLTSYIEAIQMADVSLTGCVTPLRCIPASVNYGISRTMVNNRCCSTDRCNTQNLPALNDSSPNGRRCFYCDSEDCVNILHCLGDEHYCVSAELGKEKIPVKGCASRAVCAPSLGGGGGVVAAALTGGAVAGDISCCQGNLCNGGGGRAACLALLLRSASACALSLILMFK